MPTSTINALNQLRTLVIAGVLVASIALGVIAMVVSDATPEVPFFTDQVTEVQS